MRKSQKNRQHNGQKKKDKRTNRNLQNEERNEVRGVDGDGVCGCSLGEQPRQETCQTSLYYQTIRNILI